MIIPAAPSSFDYAMIPQALGRTKWAREVAPFSELIKSEINVVFKIDDKLANCFTYVTR